MNYDVHVVSVNIEDATYPFMDNGFLEDVPKNVIVHRTKARNPLKLYARLFPKRKQTVGFADDGKKSWMYTLIRFIRGNFFIPDPRKGWNKHAWREVKRIHKSTPISCVITSTPPHSTNLVGIKIRKKLNIPWIADLRDPWTEIYYYPQLLRTRPAFLMDQKYERQTLKQADVIVTVSKTICESLRKKVHGVDKDKFHVIYNGYDAEDFEQLEPLNEKQSGITIAYAGVMAPNYGLTSLLQAWKLAFETNQNGVFLKLIGYASDEVKRQLEEVIGKEHFICTGYLPHSEALRHMKAADGLLLMIPQTPDNKGILTGKLFEYLACQKPIIGIGPEDGEAAAIIREQNAGKMIEYGDYQGLSERLRQIATFSESMLSTYDVYSRQKQALELDSLIQQKGL